jgi:two-component system sensor histidine kinase BaeS
VRGRPPLRHSLLVRLLAASVLVAVCSITATAWLAARTTSTTIRRDLGNSDARTYQTLLTYAVEHRTWDGVAATLRDLARQSGRRIVLADERRQPFADSGGDTDLVTLPSLPSGVVDPLAVDLTLTPDAPADRIDSRVTGPFLLPPPERTRLMSAHRVYGQCGGPAPEEPVRFSIGGRPLVDVDRAVAEVASEINCAEAARALITPTATEAAALRQLGGIVNACLASQGEADVPVVFDRAWQPVVPPDRASPAATSCLAAGRRDQLRTFVALPALLFVTDAAGKTTLETTLFSVDPGRIALVAAVVLLVTVGVSVLVAMLLIRPLRALTAAARRMRSGETGARVSVRSRGEIGELARAFNDMAEHRERMERQRKAMVSDVSHELRNPLGTIRSYLEGAQDGVVELDREHLSALVGETLVLQHLIDDLQDLALVDAGKLRLHPEPVEVAELLDQVATAHRSRADEVCVALVKAVDGAPAVTADPVRLRQVVTNLVTNALRYTPRGGTVRLSARRLDRHVQIEVSDTGVGIDPEDLPHVFDRFWRADRSRTRETGGSGLGLAIVHGLVLAHGGTVTASSVPGAGTTFTIRL